MSTGRNLIVNYLPPSFRDLDLMQLFQPFGRITQVKVVRNKNNESLTYGFVMFANVEDATRAMNTLNGFSIFGKHIKVSLARRRDANDKSCKLYATKIPMNYSTYALHELFVQFGNIIELRLLLDEKGNSRQIAFVEFSCKKEADAAIQALHGYVLPGERHGLVVKYAQHPNSYGNTSPASNGSNDPSSSPPPYDDNHSVSCYTVPLQFTQHTTSSMVGMPHPLPVADSRMSSYPCFPPTYSTQARSTFTSPPTSTNVLVAPAFSIRPGKSYEQQNSIYDSSLHDSGAKSCPPPSGPSETHPEGDANASSALTLTPRKYLISLHGISANHDILSFPFISSFGQVLESNISLASTPSTSSSETSSTTTSPTPVSVSTSSSGSRCSSASYVVVPKTIQQYEQLNAINNTSIRVDNCTISVHVQCLE